jgi:hypothetical protein
MADVDAQAPAAARGSMKERASAVMAGGAAGAKASPRGGTPRASEIKAASPAPGQYATPRAERRLTSNDVPDSDEGDQAVADQLLQEVTPPANWFKAGLRRCARWPPVGHSQPGVHWQLQGNVMGVPSRQHPGQPAWLLLLLGVVGCWVTRRSRGTARLAVAGASAPTAATPLMPPASASQRWTQRTSPSPC